MKTLKTNSHLQIFSFKYEVLYKAWHKNFPALNFKVQRNMKAETSLENSRKRSEKKLKTTAAMQKKHWKPLPLETSFLASLFDFHYSKTSP